MRSERSRRRSVVGLLGPVDDADLPGLGEQGGERAAGCRGVRLVDQPEVGLEPVEHAGVGVQQGLVAGEHRLEHGLPPGELELGGDVLLGDVPARQVGEQRVEVRGRAGCASRAVRSCRLASTSDSAARPRHRVDQLADGTRGELARGAGDAERRVEPAEVLGDALVGDVHVGDADGHGRRRARHHVALPQGALLLDAAQGLVHVGDVHAGPQVLVGQLLEPATVGAGHLGRRRGGSTWRRSARPATGRRPTGWNLSSVSRMSRSSRR